MKHEITTYNTKKLLSESLKKAMRNKAFSKITVSEIINDCGVNRKTFYYHFEDIYALLKWRNIDRVIFLCSPLYCCQNLKWRKSA